MIRRTIIRTCIASAVVALSLATAGPALAGSARVRAAAHEHTRFNKYELPITVGGFVALHYPEPIHVTP